MAEARFWHTATLLLDGERAVILSNEGVLPNPLPAPAAETVATSSAPAVSSLQPGTLRESERALILRALESVSWVIGGASGAAAKLGVKRTTLIAKMKKLGISRPVRHNDAAPGASVTAIL